MAGKIHYYDCYDMRKFQPGEINGFLDIGANIGTTSIMARILNPTSRVIAIEPCIETFEVLERNMLYWGIECYNIALGPGTPMNFVKRSQSGLNRFVSEDEKQWWKDSYTVESKSLSRIFGDYKFIEEPYIIKIDCEGGERFLFDNNGALDLIKNSVQTMIEIHLGFGGTQEQWNECFKKLDTHELRMGMWKDKGTSNKRYIYEPCDELIFDRGWVQMSLVNKEWVKIGK